MTSAKITNPKVNLRICHRCVNFIGSSTDDDNQIGKVFCKDPAYQWRLYFSDSIPKYCEYSLEHLTHRVIDDNTG